MRFLEDLFKGLDWLLIGPLIGIQIFGILGVYSASISEGIPFIFKKHLFYIALSWLIILILSKEKFRNALDLSLYIYLFNLLLLVLVLVTGKEVYGAKRWLSLGFINIQPSEFMKLSLVLLSAYLIPHIKRLRDSSNSPIWGQQRSNSPIWGQQLPTLFPSSSCFSSAVLAPDTS